MPKYPVITDDGKRVDRGEEQLDFANDKAAADSAQVALADMAHDALPDGKALDLTAAVDNDEGERIYEASLTFRAKTADDIKAEDARKDADADKAIEVIAKAMDHTKDPNS